MAITRYPTVSGSTYWAPLVASGSTNTKGAYVELTASTSETLRGLQVMLPQGTAPGGNYLIDIAVGAAASEVVVISNLLFCSPDSNEALNTVGVFIPIAIASGVRLSARCQCSIGSAGVNLAVLAIGGTSSAVPTTYGALTASSRGTQIDPGGSANTKGAYVEVTASTSATFDWLIAIVGTGANTAPSAGSWAFDIATGAASSEVVQVPDCGFQWSVSFDAQGPNVVTVPLSVTAGTRLAVRAQSTVTDATDRLFAVILIGVTNSGLNGSSSSSGGGSYAFVG